MNRKTNIFYDANSSDSSFLTFNNYTEALTGDILSIDYKLWPSRFLCIYIENLTSETKQDFVNKLQNYYENKLATLRDNLDDDSVIKPLNYLLTFLYWWSYNKTYENDQKSPFEIEEALYGGNADVLSCVELNYISDIVEQQYNGTYSDIICTINPSKWHKPQIKYIDLIDDQNEEIDINAYMTTPNSVFELSSVSRLHGWENENNQSILEKVSSPIEDIIKTSENTEEHIYYVKSLIKELKIIEVNDATNLKFNLVIPLFNVINTVNSNDIENDDENLTSIDLNNKVNIPLGIYFTDDDINLSINGNFATNWSLLISTQFSAFPFSFDIQQNFDDSQSTKQAYITFAQILAKQTDVTDALTKYDNLVKSLQERIIMLESKLNNISSVQNIDSIVQNVTNLSNKIENYISTINNKLEQLDNKIEDSKLKWQISTKNNTQ